MTIIKNDQRKQLLIFSLSLSLLTGQLLKFLSTKEHIMPMSTRMVSFFLKKNVRTIYSMYQTLYMYEPEKLSNLPYHFSLLMYAINTFCHFLHFLK